jgi:hypothetical protein
MGSQTEWMTGHNRGFGQKSLNNKLPNPESCERLSLDADHDRLISAGNTGY